MERLSSQWAANRLMEEWQSRVLRKGMIEATIALKSKDYDIREAHGILKQAIDRASPSTSRFTAANDYTVLDDSVKTAPIPVDLEPTGRQAHRVHRRRRQARQPLVRRSAPGHQQDLQARVDGRRGGGGRH